MSLIQNIIEDNIGVSLKIYKLSQYARIILNILPSELICIVKNIQTKNGLVLNDKMEEEITNIKKNYNPFYTEFTECIYDIPSRKVKFVSIQEFPLQISKLFHLPENREEVIKMFDNYFNDWADITSYDGWYYEGENLWSREYKGIELNN